ncbi:baseplate hub subunit and tail lysozyme [Agrobacterium phage OLIVR5]|uniref:Baseplate hub subunit and tail lysozyme n=3 Tax=Caudoviricetes TaxID=2731619 RepID=A0A858MT06_9CAUD|nr:baseplate hub subunit and tail lysozyme [Agrobacterium phage OLIVR5]QIW87862.1 baseplate hub subunit and tail lysozyme [Agrobacterium phage OLIVR5]QIW88127.1 baseplate hub subunit and tail lysozyme [Agrobacterium phage OLIVR6]
MIGIIPSEFGKNLQFWTGIVEDRGDPLQQGRVRVRIFGRHTLDTSLIPTTSLPWAQVMQGVTSAAIGGVGQSPTGIMIGTLVLGFFMDGNDMQQPCVLGTLGPIEGVTSANGSEGNGVVNSGGIEDSNHNLPGNVKFSESEPPWLSIARGEIGQKEFSGPSDNPRILEYHKTVGISGSETIPWCSSFVAWCLKKSGQSIQGANAMARSWEKAQCMEKLDTPIRGCIAVFSRPPNPNSGHVGFVDAIQGGSIVMVHGNTQDSVARSGKSAQRLVGFFWPRGYPKEAYAIKEDTGPAAPAASDRES